MIDAIEGEKRVYEGHIDAFDLDIAAAEELAREVEVDNGGYGFIQPSSIYHRFMTGLTGGKMSSSVPASHISLLDDPETGYDKVKSATTGGGTPPKSSANSAARPTTARSMSCTPTCSPTTTMGWSRRSTRSVSAASDSVGTARSRRRR
jgi:tryptophanyl-tRNA synthetase (EC 6.1.1.2)